MVSPVVNRSSLGTTILIYFTLGINSKAEA